MGEINVKDGQIVQSNFDDYKMICLKETTEINIHLIKSKEKSVGTGGAGTPLIGTELEKEWTYSQFLKMI